MTVESAVEIIKKGGVAAFPTETVYGLGADAWNPDAVKKIFELKERPEDNPLIVHLSDQEQVGDFAEEVPDAAKIAMDHCWPGPLTLVLKKKQVVLDSITSGLPTVALRIPDHPVALDLIGRTGPLAAPSANRSGRPSPTRADHVRRDFGTSIPVLDGGDSRVGLESTVLDLSQKPYSILRPGQFTVRQLSEILSEEVVTEPRETDSPRSPGVKYTHYSPSASVVWLDPEKLPDDKKLFLITHTQNPSGFDHHVHFSGDFTRMASQLYDLFRHADYLNLPEVCIEPLPSEHAHPLIAALSNRIEKASG